MKRKILIFAVLVSSFAISCKTNDNKDKSLAQKEPATENVQEEMLVGKISRIQLEKKPYKDWFIETYKAYDIDSTHLQEIDSLLQDVKITTFMGTWCSDSQREVPAFYKIMDQAEMNFENLSLIAVTRDKVTPLGLEKGKDITNVPTFIFKKNDKEIGRIVEYPVESLEKDMLKILKGEPYKHAYAE